MPSDDDHRTRQSPLRIGHASRLDPQAREITLLVLGHFLILALSMGHDEIVAGMVESGWIPARLAEWGELVIGLVLFICWGALTLRLSRIIDRLRPDK